MTNQQLFPSKIADYFFPLVFSVHLKHFSRVTLQLISCMNYYYQFGFLKNNSLTTYVTVFNHHMILVTKKFVSIIHIKDCIKYSTRCREASEAIISTCYLGGPGGFWQS